MKPVVPDLKSPQTIAVIGIGAVERTFAYFGGSARHAGDEVC
jgi:hypothetical protein